MHAIKLLLADHKKLKLLLKKVYNTTEKASKTRAQLFKIIKNEATVHEKMEEKFFYIHLKEFTKSRAKAFEHTEEVHLMEFLIPKLTKNPASSEIWSAQFQVFKELNEHHIEEEEDEIFPKASKLLTRAELNEIGLKMQAYKNKHLK